MGETIGVLTVRDVMDALLTDRHERGERLPELVAVKEPAARPRHLLGGHARAPGHAREAEVARLREDGADPALCTELEREAAGLRPSRADGEVLAPKTTAPPLATPPWETTRETAASDFARDPRAKALARLDSLPIVEKLALFC